MQIDYRDRMEISDVGTLGTPVKTGQVDLTDAALRRWRSSIWGQRAIQDAVRSVGRAAGLDEVVVNLPIQSEGDAYAALVRMDEDGDAELFF